MKIGGKGLLLALAAATLVQAAGTIRVAANSGMRSTNPGVQRDSNTDTVMLHMIEGLVGYKDDGTPRRSSRSRTFPHSLAI